MPISYNHPIRHVFVLMLENRSFDHLFGMSGIAGIEAATGAYACPMPKDMPGPPIPFAGGAPAVMPTDPGHGFGSVVEQLCGEDVGFPASHVYPPITNSGFVASYRRTFKKRKPSLTDLADIMKGVDTAAQVPAIYALATNYVLCDHWFSSLPGPTWPNRFFVHGASSSGLEHAPGTPDMLIWETVAGFRYPNGSIYDRLGRGNWRLYHDKSGPIDGQIPQVAALHGIYGSDVKDLDGFEADLAGNYPYPYTFIEPAYGDVLGDTYVRGSSQHPRDGLASGDRLVARIYNAIRQSSLWRDSLLVITYDEHGGFCDHVSPPVAPAPGDHPNPGHNQSGFDFTRYGVRVPAIVVSPWVEKGCVDSETRDHASVAATLTSLFGMAPLTDRDRHAASLSSLLTASPRPDSDCPASVTSAPAPAPQAARPVAALKAVQLVPEGSNLQAFLYVVRKAHAEESVRPDSVVAQTFALVSPPSPVATVAEAKAYIDLMAPPLFGAK